MEISRGAGVTAQLDLMFGPGTAEVGRAPGPAVARAGNPVLFDLAPRRHGYWADSCATFCCGNPSRALHRRHDVVRAALELGASIIRPGAVAATIDVTIRDALHRHGLACPHHMGHGIGTAPQEPPWLTPSSGTVLDEQMIVALEPGAYSEGFGVRLEHLYLIEANGASQLTHHSLELI